MLRSSIASPVAFSRAEPNVSNYWAQMSLLLGVGGLAFAGYGLMDGLERHDPRPVFSWLIGVSFWLSIGLGMLFMVMIWHLFDARWSVIVRRQMEHGLAAFKWLVVAFAPLLVIVLYGGEQQGILWQWMDRDAVLPGGGTVGTDPLYQAKEGYLNVPFFIVRSVAYLLIFWVLAALLSRASFEMDDDGDLKWRQRCRIISAVGVFLGGVAITFASIDWFKSLEYHWFSTMYGVWFFSASMCAGLAFTVVLCFCRSRWGALQGVYKQAHRYDLGCLCLAFTMFWAYISFSQYFLIYNANIPEETFWYTIREKGLYGLNEWAWVGLALIFLRFATPFLLLLWHHNKVRAGRLLFIVIWILGFHLLDLYWNILPGKVPADNAVGYTVRPFEVTLYDAAALIGIGGIWIWALLRSMARRASIPLCDPFIKESIHHHE